VDVAGRFQQTALSQVLRSDAEPGLRGIATFFSDEWHTRAWEHLLEVVRTGRPAIDLVYGLSFFEYFGQHPEHASNFFLGMTNFSGMEGPPVADACDFTRFRSVCDVGGGLGLLLALILQRNPAVSGVLFDQPHVIEEARRQPFFRDLASRVRFETGNMFESVPSGMDAYVLKRIVHDWPDAECAKLLRLCRSGVNPGGKLLVVEQVILADDDSPGAKLMDLEMMVLLGGKERDEADFRRIFADSGWTLTHIRPTQSGMFIIEGEPAEAQP
jgi:SAM-dependent methyltransferase